MGNQAVGEPGLPMHNPGPMERPGLPTIPRPPMVQPQNPQISPFRGGTPIPPVQMPRPVPMPGAPAMAAGGNPTNPGLQQQMMTAGMLRR